MYLSTISVSLFFFLLLFTTGKEKNPFHWLHLAYEASEYRKVDTTLRSNTKTYVYPWQSFHWKDSGSDLSSQRPALTLQHENLGHQNLWIHLLRRHLHGRVHQLGTEDGQQLRPHGFSLLPSVGTPLRPLRRLPQGAVPGQVSNRCGWRRRTRKRSGPVPLLLLLLAVGSAVLEIRWVTVRMHAVRVGAVVGEMRWVVGEVGAVAADGPRLVLLVVEMRLRGAAAARCTSRRAELLPHAVRVL